MLCHAGPMTWFLIKLAIRLVVFGGVFTFAVYRNPKVTVDPKWYLPLVAVVFGLLNTGLYWAAKPILNLATLNNFWLIMPLFINLAFLYATDAIVKPLKIAGIWTMCWLAALLTLAHGGLWLFLDKL